MSFSTKNSDTDQIYTPLTYPNESRLVELLPGQVSEPVTCSLQHFDVRDPPWYEALTYVWGDPKIRKPIAVNGHLLHVTTNLWIALQHLRWLDKPRMLWIDAIVINQEDYGERSQQIKLMSVLYSSAAQVRVWLGPADSYSDFAMEYFGVRRQAHAGTKGLADSIRKAYLRSWEMAELFSPGRKKASILELIRQSHHPDNARLPFVAIGSLFLLQSAWFTRRWCVQEIGLAREARVQCGNKEMTWEQMRVCIDTCYESGLWNSEVRYPADALPNARLLSDPKCFDKKPLADLLVQFRHWQNGDPRDTVYALLSLVDDDGGPYQISPEYSKPAVDVLVEAVKHAIHNGKNINLIARPWAPSVEGLPTWIVPVQTARHTLDHSIHMTHIYKSDRISDTKARIERPNAAGLFPTRARDAYALVVEGITLHDIVSFDDRPDHLLAMECFEVAEQGPYPDGLVGFSDQVSLWAHRKPGDKMALLSGCDFPVLLRPLGSMRSIDGAFTLIGSFLYKIGPAELFGGLAESGYQYRRESFVIY